MNLRCLFFYCVCKVFVTSHFANLIVAQAKLRTISLQWFLIVIAYVPVALSECIYIDDYFLIIANHFEPLFDWRPASVHLVKYVCVVFADVSWSLITA